MQAMAWWSVPLVAFVVAVVWVSLANRPRPRADPHDSMAEHERFRQAMRRQVDGTAGGGRRLEAPRPADEHPDPEAGGGRPAAT